MREGERKKEKKDGRKCYRTDGGYERYAITKRTPLFWGVPPVLCSLCPLPEERRLSMPKIGEKERN